MQSLRDWLAFPDSIRFQRTCNIDGYYYLTPAGFCNREELIRCTPKMAFPVLIDCSNKESQRDSMFVDQIGLYDFRCCRHRMFTLPPKYYYQIYTTPSGL